MNWKRTELGFWVFGVGVILVLSSCWPFGQSAREQEEMLDTVDEVAEAISQSLTDGNGAATLQSAVESLQETDGVTDAQITADGKNLAIHFDNGETGLILVATKAQPGTDTTSVEQPDTESSRTDPSLWQRAESPYSRPLLSAIMPRSVPESATAAIYSPFSSEFGVDYDPVAEDLEASWVHHQRAI